MKRIFKIVIIFLVLFFISAYILGSLGVGNFYQKNASVGSFVQISGEDIRYLEAGEGRDILLIHGTPGSIEDMQPLFDSLSKDYHVIAYDRPGHGYSSASNIPRNLAHNAQMANAIIDHFKLDSVKVIGHSYGGCTSMAMAVNGNPKVERFYVLGSPLFSFNCETIYKLFDIPILSTALSWMVSGWYSGHKIESELPSRFGNNSHIATAEFVQYRKNLWSQPKVILSKSLETVNIQKDFESVIPHYNNLKNDVTIIMGLDDVDYYITDLKANTPMPRVEVEYWEDCGHFVQMEQMGRLLELVRE